jgi:hypothetical protein
MLAAHQFRIFYRSMFCSKKIEDKKYNFTCCFIWLRNLVSGPSEDRTGYTFVNRMLERKFGPKGGEVTGGWRKLCNEKFHTFHYSTNIIIIITSMRMR